MLLYFFYDHKHYRPPKYRISYTVFLSFWYFFSKSTFSYYNFSGPCNNEYEFIVHQEHGSEEQEFILKAMNVEDQTHIPGKYLTALKSYDEMLENFRGISEFVIKELYRIYYR